MKINTLKLCKDAITEVVKEGDIVIDATMGRGNDTLFLRKLVGDKGEVYAFDIQEEALNSTKRKLEENNMFSCVHLILDGHENMDKYIFEKNISCVVFNFGYLPSASHKVATNYKTSIIAIQKSLNLLKYKGIVSMCVYQGGDTGFEEKDAILNFLNTLDYNEYTVIISEFLNRPNYPPIHIKIIKERE